MNQNFIIIMNQKCQIYSIKIYVGKKTPNLQQKLREEKKHQIYNTKIYVRNRGKKYAKFTISIFTWEKNAKFTTSKFTWEKKRQIYNIKIYVRKKSAKFKTSKFTWKKNEKFTTSLTNIEDNIGRVPKHW